MSACIVIEQAENEQKSPKECFAITIHAGEGIIYDWFEKSDFLRLFFKVI